MKVTKLVTLSFLLLYSIASYAQVTYKSKKIIVETRENLTTAIDSVSYVLGLDIAKSFKNQVSELNESVFIQGFLNAKDTSNALVKFDDKQIRSFLTTYFKEKQEKEFEEKYGAFKKENEEFLAKNKLKEKVKTTESGLQYVILKEGTGPSPLKSSRVKVHYHGTLIDGSVFDSSVDRGKPTEFGVNQVIKGWTEGLQLMNKGAKFKFFIPQELAYGKRKTQTIEPFSALIFEIELLEIK